MNWSIVFAEMKLINFSSGYAELYRGVPLTTGGASTAHWQCNWTMVENKDVTNLSEMVTFLTGAKFYKNT